MSLINNKIDAQKELVAWWAAWLAAAEPVSLPAVTAMLDNTPNAEILSRV
jgi:hypothetical protein